MGDFLRAAQDEERELVAELARDPRFRRLEAVRQVIALYGQTVAASVATAASIANGGPTMQNGHSRGRSADRTSAPGSKAGKIFDLAEAHLRRKGKRAKSGELLTVLEQSGIQIGGKKPNAVVSSYLSGAKQRFNNNHFGYGLANWPLDRDGAPSSEPEGAPQNMAT